MSEYLETIQYKIKNFWRYKVKGVKRVRLAVVGTPSSGKSLLISDMVQTFATMGYNSYRLEQDGLLYRTMEKYRNDAFDNGKALQTDTYACRTENHYGALLEGKTSEFDISFLNIPGETFNVDAAFNRVSLYFELRDKLTGRTGNGKFSVVQWTNGSHDKRYVVEPRHCSEEVSSRIAKAKADALSHNGIIADAKARHQNYMAWEQIYTELVNEGYTENTNSRKDISGKKLLKNMEKYVIDSVMASIGEKIVDFHIDGMKDRADFEVVANSFYFMRYCENATDIIVCDKLLVPTDMAGKVTPFADFVNELFQFFKKGGNRPHVYLAFRGADFLMQERESAYQALIKRLAQKCADEGLGNAEDYCRNSVYSLFAYLIWHHVNPMFTLPEKEIEGFLGFNPCETGDESGETRDESGETREDIDALEKMYLNLNDYDGKTLTGDTLPDIINAHIGNSGNAFSRVLNYSYPTLKDYMDNDGLPFSPHVYFTCTPITDKFVIYKNDPDSDNRRFYNATQQGDARYFDRCGSHFCFGSYQLCMDIIQQHKIDDPAHADLIGHMQAVQ